MISRMVYRRYVLLHNFHVFNCSTIFWGLLCIQIRIQYIYSFLDILYNQMYIYIIYIYTYTYIILYILFTYIHIHTLYYIYIILLYIYAYTYIIRVISWKSQRLLWRTAGSCDTPPWSNVSYGTKPRPGSSGAIPSRHHGFQYDLDDFGAPP